MGNETVVNFDQLREETKASFILDGVEYPIPPVTYKVLVQLSEIDKQVNEAIKNDDAIALMDNSIKGAILAVPELTEELLKDSFSVVEIRKIGEMINTTVLGGMEDIDPEVVFYREKYGDEFRKNSDRTKEKKRKRS